MTERLPATVVSMSIVGFARALTGVRAIWNASSPRATPTLYFANHSSHIDFVLIWATLPPDLRQRTRPVAAADYWSGSKLRSFLGHEVFNAVLIDRVRKTDGPDPVDLMSQALAAGDSLIIFPEGTRNTGDEALLPLKSGIYNVARACPDARLVPVWIENLRRVLPKGAILPLPLACTVRYGEPLVLEQDEKKQAFMARVRQALLALRPEYDWKDSP